MSFYEDVPKTLVENLEFRAKLRRWASGNAGRQRQILEMCRQDTLFFINALCYVIEPREVDPLKRVKPFITWVDTQDPFIREIDACRAAAQARSSDTDPEAEELWVEKSRGEGFTWCVLMTLLNWWLTQDYCLIGMTSKDENSVDNPDDPDSLFWKLDWELGMLPSWMAGVRDVDFKRKLSEHTLTRTAGKSAFTGYAATGHAGSGGRKTVWFLDELSKFPRPADQHVLESTQYVTAIRIVGSTYFGKSGAFYDGMADQDSTKRKYVFDWKDNPRRNRGLYKVIDGKPFAVDPLNNPIAPEYLEKLDDIHKRLKRKAFQLEGTVRSQWYNAECLRPRATPQSIAQELDRNPSGTDVSWMDPGILKTFLEGEDATVREPTHRGRMAYDPVTFAPRFIPHSDGDLLVWCDLEPEIGPDGRMTDRLAPPRDRDYTMGADISLGVGASNSSAFILDKKTGQQVGEYTTMFRRQAEYARDCVAICNWFKGPSGGAFLGWETNGPGSQFTETIREINYANVYRQKKKEIFGDQYTDRIGWHSSNGDKSDLLGGVDGGGLLDAILERRVIIRSRACLVETGEYVFVGGKLVHRKSRTTSNEAGKNEAHGDRVIGAGVAVHLCSDRPQSEEPVVIPEPTYGGREWRDQRAARERREERDESFVW